MNTVMQIIIATSFSLLITFTFYTVLNGKQANNSLFQHIVADTIHYTFLSSTYLINQRNNTSYLVSLSTSDKRYMLILGSCPFFLMALIWFCGSKIVPRLLLGMLTIYNVWLLARWCDGFDVSYSIDKFTVYFVVWQFSYLMFQWCLHQLSWPSLIFYQASICILTAIKAFIFYDLYFRYFPLINLVIIWFACFDDIFACLYIHGRQRNLLKNGSMDYLMPTYPTFPVFCYYTHDIEDGIDATNGYLGLGDGDFFVYNSLLLWILPPLSSRTIQTLVFFGLTINIQIGFMLTIWIGSLWKEYRMPALPLPVIFVSAYALVVDFIIKKLDIDNVKTLDCV